MAHAASAVAASAAPVACLALLPPDALALVCAHYDTVRDAVRLAATCRDVGGVLAALPDVSRVIAAARQRGGTELAPTSTAARPPPPWLDAEAVRRNPFAPILPLEWEAAYAAWKEGGRVGPGPLNPEQRAAGKAALAYARLRWDCRAAGATPEEIEQRARRMGLSQIVLVTGAGGTGKSALVHALEREYARHGIGSRKYVT